MQAQAAQPSGGQPAAGNLSTGVAHEITHGPSFAMLRVDLQPGQTLVAEAGSMVARHQHVGMEVKMNAGRSAGLWAMMKAFVIAVIRKLVGGETFFVNHFTVPQPGSVWVAPTMSGQVTHRRLAGETLTLSSGAYVASVGDVDMKMKFGGLRSMLAKEGAFFLQVGGHGDLWFNSYGGIEAIDVDGPYIVDNGHLVGFEGNLRFDIKGAGGGLMGLMASGEGLVCEFNGQGRVYIQSRNPATLVDWLTRIMPG
ncbi:MAG: TIGR00266 family protein [Sandaracinaceae bacterium]|nr:MAG: TIGR00266 family protein [Sandaracinaceae bacterium]HBQ12061.1 TIGR00266 family protein [Myxococcales bacterium]